MQDETVNLICVLSEHRDGDFSAHDVTRLLANLQRHMPVGVDYRFVVLSNLGKEYFGYFEDLNVSAELVRLRRNLPGWWSKMEMFTLDRGPCIYFDLDTVICGDLGPLVDTVLHAEDPIFLGTFIPKHPMLQSGLMGWRNPNDVAFLWEDFVRDFAPLYRTSKAGARLRMHDRNGHAHIGDQEWIRSALERRKATWSSWQDQVDGIYSYKINCRDRGLPEDAMVVCFHGQPRPNQVNEPWVVDNRRIQ